MILLFVNNDEKLSTNVNQNQNIEFCIRRLITT